MQVRFQEIYLDEVTMIAPPPEGEHIPRTLYFLKFNIAHPGNRTAVLEAFPPPKVQVSALQTSSKICAVSSTADNEILIFPLYFFKNKKDGSHQ